MRRRSLLAGLGLALCVLAVSVAPRAEPVAPLVVFAAASLKTALDEALAAYRRAGGGPVAATYAGTPALARQIEAGAPADLFFSADTAWMDWAEQRDLVSRETRTDLLGNRIVLVAPKGMLVSLALGPGTDLAALIGDGRLAIADVDAVPAGRYGKAALQTLGLWQQVADRLAQTENVRVALAFVARGEAPLGLVYATDAAAEPAVETIAVLPDQSHPPIVYPLAVTAASDHPEVGALLGFLASPAARPIFERHGFAVLHHGS